MKDKRPIDRKRESAGMANIGTKEDGAIIETTKIGERLIVIKEKSIYEFMMADEIDPERTNIKLPNNIHKLIINQGSESELVSRVFLTAKTLFKTELFSKEIDVNKALTLSLKLLLELTILDKEISSFIQKEKQLCDEYEANRDKPVSYSIPSFGDIETRCKTIFQKADHYEQILMEIITIFFIDLGLTKQSHFPNFYEKIKTKYTKEDPFSKFLNSTLSFMKRIRAFRNAFDHRLETVNVFDFELQKNSDVLMPSFELKHKDVKMERQSITEFLAVIVPNMILIFENTIAYMSNKTFTPSLMANGVREIPEDKRRYKFVKYSFWAPLGVRGYYNQ